MSTRSRSNPGGARVLDMGEVRPFRERKPAWFKRPAPGGAAYRELRAEGDALADPDGNRLEIYYEMPGALARFPEGRGDQNFELAVSGTGEPLPAWLSEKWPTAAAQQETH